MKARLCISLVCSVSFLFMISCNKNTQEELTVLSGAFRQSITESGVLEAVHATFVPMPTIDYRFGSYCKITGLAEHGIQVHKGDSVAALDPSNLYRFLLEREDELENEKAAANKKRVEMENSYQELNANLKSEQAAYELKKLELERSRFESDAVKRIKELEFQQAEIRLNKVKRNLELNPVLEDYDMRIQKIRVMQRENDIADALVTIKKFTIYSPGDGIFQIERNRSTGQPIRLGDEVYRGYLLARIPDISRMKALSYVNEVDIRKVRPGMNVIVSLDAMPHVPFNGVITSIDRICTEREQEKVFRTEIEILDSDLSLKPGMSVSCEYICYESEDDMFVPNSCLHQENGQSYVFVKRGGSVKKVGVTPGPSNANHTVITGDVKPGQQLMRYEWIAGTLNQ